MEDKIEMEWRKGDVEDKLRKKLIEIHEIAQILLDNYASFFEEAGEGSEDVLRFIKDIAKLSKT